jgi:phytoene synthase
MKKLFDKVSATFSRSVTHTYSTSFTLGIKFLDGKLHEPIYNIYGFVRCADEIVDSFHGYDKKFLLEKFITDTFQAIEQKISVNPVLNSFQETVNKYDIDKDLISSFLISMKMDLNKTEYNRQNFEEYIYGSAEAVGLMCLKVFTDGDASRYNELKPYAMKLGSAFQKVNFLRDLGSDINELGRFYFPSSTKDFTTDQKVKFEKEIEQEFRIALEGIRLLPSSSRKGVYLAYSYYKNLFHKIKRTPIEIVLSKRIRLPGSKKISLMLNCLLKEQFNTL